ncbi:hypothetical protein M3G03_10070 [Aestuariimicrobium sp. p3-SID1156]|uniref:hypothetical protein n=1 Tax=Aestuariimicrobium sp. p3-SID1156 TaxID=2916038 RepID=UPI00223C10FE|nr:hypothetical protein [Aestuariimicrobium sp. p3-SID1156]MCT1459876.1 hypothetical protein [Aestuariimicrobium sp. p3-SID1156]
MVSPPESTLALYGAQLRRSNGAALLALHEWQLVGGRGDWLAQWQKRIPRVAAIVGAAQVTAASEAAGNVPEALEDTGFPERQLAVVEPKRFAGWTEHAPLLVVLSSPVIKARMASGSEDEMLAAGGRWLERMVSTLVADAGRAASGVQIAATEDTGWVRYEPAPYCQRCAPLVGKWFRHSQGFQRHPQCPAVHRPASRREPPRGYASRPDPDQVKDLTEAQKKALADGADLFKVVNSHRHKRMEPAGIGNVNRRGTPAWIYAQAGDDRAAAVRLFRQFGYLK